MKLKKIAVILLLQGLAFIASGQSELQIQNIGDLITVANDTIKNCKIGYRTSGTLNKDKSNVVFMPTWHLGTSEDNLEYLTSIMDTKDKYLIVVDALGNGVSSSPSNHEDLPEISIRDMVKSQHKLLTDHLNIQHINLLVGVSMGGMQALEWMVAYPEFMKQVISINGTPKASSYDKALWGLIVTLIEDAGEDEEALTYAMKRVSDVGLLASTSPTYLSNTYQPEDIEDVMTERYERKIHPFDKLSQSKAILNQDIYKNRDLNSENMPELVKAKIMIITAEHDHVVNPIYSRNLSKTLNCELLELRGDCGHISAFCDTDQVRRAIADFLD